MNKIDIKPFAEWHDQFLANWKEAMITGDTSGVEQMDDSYFVTFFTDHEAKPVFYSYEEAMDGMRQSVTDLQGFEKRFENRIIRMKSDDRALVFYEQVLLNDGTELSRIFTTEEWHWNGEGWAIIREVNMVV